METKHTIEERPSSGARAFLWLVLIAIAVHSAAVALWVAPPNTLKDRVGFERLRSYVLPMFDQGWSIFAPEADNGYDLFEIRGTLRAGGRQHQTEWVPVSAREVGPRMRYHPFPSRTVLITDRLAGDQLRLFDTLGDAQKQVVNVAEIDVSVAEQGRRLLAAATTDAERDAATSYARTETAVERYLSGIAVGIWGDQVVGIEFRQNQVFVPNYQTSHGQRQATTGWLFASKVRPVVPLSGAERAAFRSYVRKLDIR